MTTTLLSVWHHQCAETLEQAWIPPDGCQDLVGVAVPGAPVQWHVYALSTQAETIELPVGALMCGYRLAPGTVVDTTALLQHAHTLDLEDFSRTKALLSDATTLDLRVQESLQALATSPTVALAAGGLGVSQRTLERLLRKQTGQTPTFWRALARLRQTARSLGLHAAWPLAEVAAAHCYADQAHMNLAFRRWLGCSPARLQRDTQRLDLLVQSGYGSGNESAHG